MEGESCGKEKGDIQYANTIKTNIFIQQCHQTQLFSWIVYEDKNVNKITPNKERESQASSYKKTFPTAS